jgi:hypothetical protein
MLTHRRYSYVVLAALTCLFLYTEQPRASSLDEVPARAWTTCGVDEGRLPDRVQIDRILLPQIGVMLRRSPTFREQCRRVAATPLLYVRVRVNRWLEGRQFRARTRILRFHSGVVIAEMDLQSAWSSEEWIAHEFEHVLEQIDRVPLVELAARTGSVWRTADDMFESERAIRAGRTVAAESRRVRKTRDDGFVE